MKMNRCAIYNRGLRLIFFFTALKRKLLLGELPACCIDFNKKNCNDESLSSIFI